MAMKLAQRVSNNYLGTLAMRQWALISKTACKSTQDFDQNQNPGKHGSEASEAMLRR